jgi:hypothetical protein
VRSILWYDWLYLYRHRRQLTCLDNVLLLTRGKPFSLTHFLFAIHPTDRQFTGVYESPDSTEKSIAQVYQSSKSSSAYINFLLHLENAPQANLVSLLEHLVKQAGCWGANQVVADLESDALLFPLFRQAGFSVLAKQQVFKCPPPEKAADQSTKRWRIWKSADIPAMRCLYQTLVPPLVQPVEPLSRREMLGLVFYDQKGCLQAYADLVYGPTGIWVLPVIHPQVKEDMAGLLTELLQALPDRNGRNIYVTTRSYQPWVEQALLDLSANPGPEQAVMVHYMALRQRVVNEFSFASIENGCREPTLPLARIENHTD